MTTVFGEPGPRAITIAQDSLTIAWDTANGTITRAESTVASFNLYFRDRGTREWSLVSSIAATENPAFTVGAAEILGEKTAGEFEFGVSSVTGRGEESPIHSSVDFDARPPGGWYFIWTRP